MCIVQTQYYASGDAFPSKIDPKSKECSLSLIPTQREVVVRQKHSSQWNSEHSFHCVLCFLLLRK